MMMRERRSCVVVSLVGIALLMSLSIVRGENTLQSPVKLVWHYYKLNATCPYAEEYIKHQVKLFWDKDKSIAAKFLRLLSADCLSKNVLFFLSLFFLLLLYNLPFFKYDQRYWNSNHKLRVSNKLGCQLSYVCLLFGSI